MNPAFETHLQEVHSHYQSGDAFLGLRRLTDCAFETQNPEVFRKTIAFYEWLETNTDVDKQEVLLKVNHLLETIRNAGPKTEHKENAKILSVQKVTKTYLKSGFKIKDLNFELNERQITGLVGENGNGKTTLLRLLAAELKPDNGLINYSFSKDAADTYELKTKLIYIEQRIPRWYGTLMDNLHFVLPYYGIKGEDGHLWADMMIARLGLRPYRHLTWNRISSGYRTRFELAKTLLRKPKILLLDEPLANLDILSQQTILQDLKFMANSITAPFGMILSSQHIYEVEKVSDTIIFIKNGVPQYQTNNTEYATGNVDSNHNELIVELETSATREVLAAAFNTIGVTKIQYNGGVFLLHFPATVSIGLLLETMAKNNITPNYFRNISNSSRRFFIN